MVLKCHDLLSLTDGDYRSVNRSSCIVDKKP
jgi:hypothetical protein